MQTAAEDAETLDLVARQIDNRLGTAPSQARSTWFVRFLNHLFSWGLWVFVALFLAILLPRGAETPSERVISGYVLVGAIVVGGQVLLSMAFAGAVMSPSFREREYGFRVVERLLGVWGICVVLAGVLALWIGLSSVEPWMMFSMFIYGLAIALVVLGYLTARRALEVDRDTDRLKPVEARHLIANALFFVAFLCEAFVVVLVVANGSPLGP